MFGALRLPTKDAKLGSSGRSSSGAPRRTVEEQVIQIQLQRQIQLCAARPRTRARGRSRGRGMAFGRRGGSAEPGGHTNFSQDKRTGSDGQRGHQTTSAASSSGDDDRCFTCGHRGHGKINCPQNSLCGRCKDRGHKRRTAQCLLKVSVRRGEGHGVARRSWRNLREPVYVRKHARRIRVFGRKWQ